MKWHACASQAQRDPLGRTAARYGRVTPVPPPRRAPRAGADVTIRAVRPEELAVVAHGLQNFARRHVLGPVPGGDDLAAWLAVRVRGAVLNEYVVAVTRSGGGDVVAGLGLENESLISTMRVVRMPAALRLANALVHVVPRDGVMHNLNVRLPWFRSGQEPALRQLFSAGAVAVARTRVEPGRPGRPHRPGGPRPAAAALVAVVDLRVVVREPDGVVLPDLPVAATV